jgi:linoleate 10R-lipoxygenase
MSRLPDGSPFSDALQKFVIELCELLYSSMTALNHLKSWFVVYKDLPHPPSDYLSLVKALPPSSPALSNKNVPYAFRDADGMNYNRLSPSLGMAGTPYARSVPSSHVTLISALPDPGLVFDTLLRRDKEFRPHPAGISSLFFAFANLIIHDVFNTDHCDWTINNASSYLDLSPLYGSSQKAVDSVRRKDGTGKLWDDVFADTRLLLMPPSVCALLVIFSRNHNFIAEKILDINERRNFESPPSKDETKMLAQDEEIFQRARLVNTGFFMQIILGDYVGAILGLVRDGLSWRLNPLMVYFHLHVFPFVICSCMPQTMRQLDHEFSPRGEGNVVSIEFNMLYRWHAATSLQDVEWTEKMFKKVFKGKDFSKVSATYLMKISLLIF